MFSLPDDWDYTLKGLAYLSTDGIDSIRSGIQELERAGYIFRSRIRDEHGHLRGTKYKVYPTPHSPGSDVPTLENPTLVNPAKDVPVQANPTQLNIDITSTEESNNDLSTIDSIPSSDTRPSVLAALDAKRREEKRNTEI